MKVSRGCHVFGHHTGAAIATQLAADRPKRVDALALSGGGVDIVVPALCVAEVAYFLGKRHGADVEARFLEGIVRV